MLSKEELYELVLADRPRKREKSKAPAMRCPHCGQVLNLTYRKPMREQVVALHEQGLSIKQIAEEVYKGTTYKIANPEYNVWLHLRNAGIIPPTAITDREELRKRAKEIYEAHKAGETFKSIAARYQRSSSRIQRIFQDEKWRRERGGDEEPVYDADTTISDLRGSDALNARIRYSLYDALGYDTKLAEIAKLPDERLLRIRNFGKVSLRELRTFLDEAGYS